MLELIGICFLIGLLVLMLFSKDGREKLGALELGAWILFVGSAAVIAIGAAVLFGGLYLFNR